MKPIVIDPELEVELQELYILSKHWTSDMNFVEDELRILKDILDKYLTKTENLKRAETRNFAKILSQQDLIVHAIKAKILLFLKFIEPMVDESKKEIGLDLVEKFIALESEIKSLSAYVQLLRKLLFSLTEDVMREEKNNTIIIN